MFVECLLTYHPHLGYAAPAHTSTRDLVVVVVRDVLVAHVKQILAAVAPRQRLVADPQVRVCRRGVHVMVLPAQAWQNRDKAVTCVFATLRCRQ